MKSNIVPSLLLPSTEPDHVASDRMRSLYAVRVTDRSDSDGEPTGQLKGFRTASDRMQTVYAVTGKWTNCSESDGEPTDQLKGFRWDSDCMQTLYAASGKRPNRSESDGEPTNQLNGFQRTSDPMQTLYAVIDKWTIVRNPTVKGLRVHNQNCKAGNLLIGHSLISLKSIERL